MLAKGMHLIEFENCIFKNSEWELPPDTRFLNFKRFIKVLTKASKQ